MRQQSPPFFARLWSLVEQIPPGRVTTYGALAWLLVGEARAARTVGWALHGLPAERAEAVPWWRVVNCEGRISTSCLEHPAALQAARLKAEGVIIDADGRIDLRRYGWWGEAGSGYRPRRWRAGRQRESTLCRTVGHRRRSQSVPRRT